MLHVQLMKEKKIWLCCSFVIIALLQQSDNLLSVANSVSSEWSCSTCMPQNLRSHICQKDSKDGFGRCKTKLDHA